ncbi:MAG: hypothetical protein PHI86_02635 [Candidatus Omnitrophica bacterium]|nr:hypothetical protein [Candidatus Omnitrophota bacterium]
MAIRKVVFLVVNSVEREVGWLRNSLELKVEKQLGRAVLPDLKYGKTAQKTLKKSP